VDAKQKCFGLAQRYFVVLESLSGSDSAFGRDFDQPKIQTHLRVVPPVLGRLSAP